MFLEFLKKEEKSSNSDNTEISEKPNHKIKACQAKFL